MESSTWESNRWSTFIWSYTTTDHYMVVIHAYASYLKCVIWFSRSTRSLSLISSKRSFSSTVTVPIPSGLKDITFTNNDESVSLCFRDFQKQWWNIFDQCFIHMNCALGMLSVGCQHANIFEVQSLISIYALFSKVKRGEILRPLLQ